MDRRQTLIVLDRDGVLNRTVPNPAEPRPDSPLDVSEAEVFPWVPGVLRDLTAQAGYSAGRREQLGRLREGQRRRAPVLDAVHAEILRQAEVRGRRHPELAHLCFHRAEDRCACRKPATGPARRGVRAPHPRFAPASSWMVGDRETDVLAGAAFGLRTAFLDAEVGVGALDALAARSIRPSFCGVDLRDFAVHLLGPR